jgi:hypothetical protein
VLLSFQNIYSIDKFFPSGTKLAFYRMEKQS